MFSDSTIRSSRQEVFGIKIVFKIFAIFTGEKRLRHRCFPVNIVEFLRITLGSSLHTPVLTFNETDQNLCIIGWL